ncbi:unnamed protein product [Phytophthora fragariaefolia]|uniref:Unnamed protein product n=1 Tax=Phytophthora fragariaefolia TaxID=1490495 RepID=A0A9W6Y5I2_9STRA|nr:unnamed protein product [Phytophthora fragariaefolia]
MKQRKEKAASSSDESDAKPRRKKAKATVKQVTTSDGRNDSRAPVERGRAFDSRRRNGGGQANDSSCFRCGQAGHWSAQCTTECIAMRASNQVTLHGSVRMLLMAAACMPTENESDKNNGEETKEEHSDVEDETDEDVKTAPDATSKMDGDVPDVVQMMANEAASRDEGRAAGYVASVRPAMASVRFVRADREKGMASSVDHSVALGGEQLVTGEGASQLRTGEGER